MKIFITTFIWAFLAFLTFIFGLECITNVPAHIERIQYMTDIKIAAEMALVMAVIFGIQYRELWNKINKH